MTTRKHASEKDGGLCWADSPVSLAPLTFFDIETTGLRPDRGARITEVALLDARETLFHAQTPAGEASLSISDDLPRLLSALAGCVVVGHNLKFDFKFVAYEARRHEASLPSLQFIDTLGLARTVLGSGTDCRLEALLRRCDLLPEASLHQALVDAKATRALFWRLTDEGNLQTLADVGAKPLAWTAP